MAARRESRIRDECGQEDATCNYLLHTGLLQILNRVLRLRQNHTQFNKLKRMKKKLFTSQRLQLTSSSNKLTSTFLLMTSDFLTSRAWTLRVKRVVMIISKSVGAYLRYSIVNDPQLLGLGLSLVAALTSLLHFSTLFHYFRTIAGSISNHQPPTTTPLHLPDPWRLSSLIGHVRFDHS